MAAERASNATKEGMGGGRGWGTVVDGDRVIGGGEVGAFLNSNALKSRLDDASNEEFVVLVRDRTGSLFSLLMPSLAFAFPGGVLFYYKPSPQLTFL